MEKKYIINKYSKAIIEGLGCEVILSDNENSFDIQGVYGIKNKKTDEWLSHNTRRIIYDDCEFDRVMNVQGVKTECFYKDGLEIRLEEHGDMLITSDCLCVHVFYNRKDDDSMHMKIDIGRRDDIELLFKSCKSNRGEPEILVKTFIGNNIAHIYTDWDKWNIDGKEHSIDEFTPEFVVKSIIKDVKEYKYGDLWNERMEKGLKILTPALKLYATDFLREWIICLKNRVKESIKEEQRKKYEINQLQNEILMNRELIDLLKNAKSRIASTVKHIENGSKRK